MSRKDARPVAGVILAAGLLSGPVGSLPAAEPSIVTVQGERGAAVAVQGLAPAVIDRLRGARLGQAEWQRILAVRVAEGPSRNPPAILGAYTVNNGALVFSPRFGLRPGLRYRAIFDPSALPGGGTGERVSVEIALPAEPSAPSVNRVRAAYPSSEALPENLLRFYVHFSGPMRQGESYRFVRLVELGGDTVELPFLELAEELWDPEGRRLTLLLDPGRIKRGLVPHEDVGLALRAGKRYALVVSADWRDAQGAPLVEGFRKEFRVVEADRASPAPRDWEIVAPEAGTRAALRVHFGEPLDEALLQRLIWVEDESGTPLPGTIHARQEETSLDFVPERPWSQAPHKIRVDPILEDVAGNSVGRPFEVMDEAEAAADDIVTLVFSPGAH